MIKLDLPRAILMSALVCSAVAASVWVPEGEREVLIAIFSTVLALLRSPARKDDDVEESK